MVHKELVIEHYGVKGMKWGVRKAVDRAKASGRMGINSYVHPVASTKVALKTAKTRPSSLIYNSTKNVEKFNADVRKEVDRSKQLKSNKKKNIQRAKDNYKKEVAIADKVFLKEYNSALKSNEASKALHIALSQKNVKLTQDRAYKARLAIKQAKKAPLSKKNKKTPATAAMRKMAEIPKEFNPKLMPDGRSIEITGTETGKKEVWKVY